MTDICSGKACLAANYMPPVSDSAAEKTKKLMFLAENSDSTVDAL